MQQQKVSLAINVRCFCNHHRGYFQRRHWLLSLLSMLQVEKSLAGVCLCCGLVFASLTVGLQINDEMNVSLNMN